MTGISELDRAHLRLKCWEIISGWGKKIGDKIETWDFETRMEKAKALADWAVATSSEPLLLDKPAPDEHTNFKV